jgi:hypothetical protein
VNSRVRRAGLLLAVVALAAGVGGSFVASRSERELAHGTAASPVQPGPVPEVSASPYPSIAGPTTPTATTAPPRPFAASAVARSIAPLLPATGTVDVCGSGRVRVDQVHGLHLGAPAARSLAPAVQSIVTALAGGDALARGASLLVAQMAELPSALPPAELQARLVDLALSSGDVDVWTLARHLCGDAAGPGTCERVNPQAWSRIDPGNAAPWLWSMAQAQAAHQEQEADEALYRASQARFHDARIMGLGRVLAHPALDPRRGLPAHLVTLALIGVQAGYALPSYALLLKRCAEPQLADANRRLVCDDVARLLVERSRGAIDVSIGYRLAERLRWEAGRLRAVDDLRLALQSPALTPELAAEPADLLSCTALDGMRDRAVTQAQTGERAYLAGRLDALGLDTTDAARSVRAQRAAAAASASQSTPP